MGTGTGFGIALGVGAALAVVWWIFDSAPAESRRGQFDRRTRTWGERQVGRGWRRPSFVVWVGCAVLVVLLLVWSAVR
jgi:hypothetical protein